jgi:16S rRNA (cytosine1402-N4)-methyltransferase
MSKYHLPVMLKECITALDIKPGGRYVDVTFGGGGHSKAILQQLDPGGVLVAFDQDEDAKANLPHDKRLVFVDQNFEYMSNHLRYQGLVPVDGLLADLGVSSHQFDTGDRGFSFRFEDALLDMRMNKDHALTAAHVLNHYTEEQLANVFHLYGELPRSRQLAKEIVASRNKRPVETVADLRNAVAASTPKYNEYTFYAQLFQALRIEVNRELDVLKRLLEQSEEVIKTNGRLVVMSYHSLEDRLVKNYMNSGNFTGHLDKDLYGNTRRPFRPLFKKAMMPGEEEIRKNPRSRSARLRVAEKI